MAAAIPARTQIGREASFLPARPEERSALLRAFLLEKALYEIRYEMNHRPEWLRIPLKGALELLGPAE